MDLQLKGKTALITGGSKGIGLEIALTLAAEGCNIGLCARHKNEVEAAAKVAEKGVKVVGEVVDITDDKSLEAWFAKCADQLGGIDIFVANASAGGADVSENGWRQNFETDVLATWRAVNGLLPYLEKSSAPSIVMISSTAALEKFAGAVPFGAMKAAMLNYAGNLAHDLAPKGIRVNSVSPGPVFIEGGAWDQIKAAMPEVYESVLAAIPIGRMGTAADVATQVALLASPLSGYTTGANIVMDGCYTQRLNY
ncbi:MAG: SDR family oxidoreductase [Pseudomonadota bacterium]|nr:SDR family oxidoreductase [Pseudomonadota bacterium]